MNSESSGPQISTARWLCSANLKRPRFAHPVRASAKSFFNKMITAAIFAATTILIAAKLSFAAAGRILAENYEVVAMEYRPLN